MDDRFEAAKQRYAELLIRTGVNIQPGQCLTVTAELAHADIARRVVAEAYRAGAKYVRVDWRDAPVLKARYVHSQAEFLDFMPDFEHAMFNEMAGGGWTRLALAGDEFPEHFADVDAGVIRRVSVARAKRAKAYTQAQMSNRFQWCVAAVPTPAWARQVFPELDEDAAVERLWRLVLATTRADQPDPVGLWNAHDARLRRVADHLTRDGIVAVRLFDPTPAPDGFASTDLTIGLTAAPYWVAPSSHTPAGNRFFANIPTEEVFTSPHRLRARGHVRSSKPSFPLDREVDGAYFRFEDGQVVAFDAVKGKEALQALFDIRGARRLGEVALVDVRSPINQAGVLFHETLFDENAVCHIAFGTAYTEGLIGSDDMSDEEREAAGLNDADTHVDFMVGTDTMDVFGVRADGSELPIMRAGRFVAELAGE